MKNNTVLDNVKGSLEKLDQKLIRRNLDNKNKLLIPLHLQNFNTILANMISMATKSLVK